MKALARLQSWALFAGVAVGFALAIGLGHQAAGYSKPSGFRRFHQEISPDAAFYPPFSLLENLARARWQPGKTIVIVGGNSIFNGVGQPPDGLWTNRLQELLGDSYVVVNLSFRGAFASEGAALVAESLMKSGIPVLYVANTAPGPLARPYESVYAWLFWQAREAGRLLDNLPRDTELKYRMDVLPRAAVDRLRSDSLAANLNRWLRFQELWHHVSYRHFATVWSIPSRAHFLRPKDAWIDAEPPPAPLAERFQGNLPIEMQIARGYFETYTESDGAGGWRATTPSVIQTEHDIDEIFAPALRARTIMVLSRNAPIYREHLTAEERVREDTMIDVYLALWAKHGVRAITFGPDFESADYFDRTHLLPSGGEKLARQIAREIHTFPSLTP